MNLLDQHHIANKTYDSDSRSVSTPYSPIKRFPISRAHLDCHSCNTRLERTIIVTMKNVEIAEASCPLYKCVSGVAGADVRLCSTVLEKLDWLKSYPK